MAAAEACAGSSVGTGSVVGAGPGGGVQSTGLVHTDCGAGAGAGATVVVVTGATVVGGAVTGGDAWGAVTEWVTVGLVG